jgi:hypothetical protein
MKYCVECYGGYKYAQRPRAFLWADKRWKVLEILTQAHTPEGAQFRVRTEGDHIFELSYEEYPDTWHIVPC